MIGTTLLHYAIDARLGQGGMGTVYRAQDTVLMRTVAIKVLASVDPDAARRLLHEARAASALNHPHIVTVYAVEQHEDTAFIVMEYVEGEPLNRAIPPGGLPIDRALTFACDMAHALAAAHERGIIHRDIKPGNVMVTTGAQIKVLDFGIARRAALAESATQTVTVGTLSGQGLLVGTPGYLAPEQIMGEPASPQSDVFALGAVMYQMLTGVAPFAGGSTASVMDMSLHRDPIALTSVRPDVPAALVRIVSSCLEKDPARRPASARELFEDLDKVRRDRVSVANPSRTRLPKAMLAAGALLALIGVGAVASWQIRERRVERAHAAVAEMTRLAEAGDFVGAYRLARQTMAVVPDDVRVQAAWHLLTVPAVVNSNPEGAAVAFRSYSGTDAGGWIEIGKTPASLRVPFGLMRWRISKDGYEPQEIAPNPFPSPVVLVPMGTSPAGMVHVPAGSFALDRRGAKSVSLPEYWIDRLEVTNREFKAFVDARGYQKREFWTEPFVKDGRQLSWEAAMDLFRDATNRPGPSTWELGAYKDGEDDRPVSGVSWYEAAAYAVYAGKTLPTMYHWYAASGAFSPFSEILSFSNFGGQGTVKGGASGGLGPFGTYDMAGNVKEWTWNETDGQRRFVLGGAWNEATHQFHDADARSPFERGAGFGFRCILQKTPMDASLRAAEPTLERDPKSLIPVDDKVYAAYKRLYDYDPVPLEMKVEERDDTQPHWIMERVSIRAAYGTERLPILLYLPRSAKPPYQVVMYFPGSEAVRLRSSHPVNLRWLEFLMRDGRAVAYPVYQQTYERRRENAGGMNFLRQMSIERGQDVRRTVDYLQSRADIDHDKIAFYGLSLGAQLGPVYLATEPRLRTGVLLSGGFETWTIPPEADPVNFATRVRQPVIMVNGRDDFDLPLRSAQIPLFNALGTAPADKRHAVLDGGHLPPTPQLVFREILDWLDKYLGPVGK